MTRKMAVVMVTVALLAVVGSVVPALASCSYRTTATASGYLTGSGDEDQWNIDLTKGMKYNFRLTVGYNDDFDIFVYYWVSGPNGWEEVYVAAGIKGTGEDESVFFTVPRNTTYYIEIVSWRGSGNYTLTIKRWICS